MTIDFKDLARHVLADSDVQNALSAAIERYLKCAFGGEAIYVQKTQSKECKLGRDERIRQASRSGTDNRQLAAAHRLSVRQVRRIANKNADK